MFAREDRVYGRIEWSSPVLTAVAESPSVQRLKGIDMAGYSSVFYPGTSHDRFQHSTGVCHLLLEYGASEAEALAGLLHDVSHTAFSHCADYALEGGSETEQDLQDNLMVSFLKRSEIPAVLARYGYGIDDIVDSTRYPLLETELPDLCADRIDYILRGALHYGYRDEAWVRAMLDALEAKDGHWIFRVEAAAHSFAETFATINAEVYAGPTSALMFRSVGDCLKEALKRGVITPDDLFGDDLSVVAKLKAGIGEDETLRRHWKRMHKLTEAFPDEGNPHVRVTCKSRVVDPRVGDASTRLSAVDPAWAALVKREQTPKRYAFRYAD